MDRRTLLFVVISVGIIFLYQELVLKRLAPPPGREPPAASVEATPAPRAGASAAAATASASPARKARAADAEGKLETERRAAVEGRRIVVRTDLYEAVLTTAGGRLEDLRLEHYRETPDPDSPPLSLVAVGPEVAPPLGVEIRGARVWSDAGSEYRADRDGLALHGDETGTLTLRTELGGQPIVKQLTFHGDRYPFELRVRTPPRGDLPPELAAQGPNGEPPAVAIVLTRRIADAASRYSFTGPAALIDGKVVQKKPSKIEHPELLSGEVRWAGFEDHYFLSVVAPERASAVRLRPLGTALESEILSPLPARGAADLGYTVYFGPKEREALEAAGHDLVRGLDFGWFGAIAVLLLHVLNFSHRFTGNFGLDIILLTILVKAIFYPLTQKSFESMRAMQKIQPEMQRLKEKFKDDPKQMNTEMMELYRRHKVNPLGGCLPMVLQIPVFIGLYRALQNSIELRHAPFFLWVRDLAAPERLYVGGYGIPVLTILLGASMFLQQRMTPQAGDPSQQKIMMFMPLIFTFMFIGFPAGLTVYWLTNNVLTIGQQWVMLRKSAPKPAS